MDVINWSTYAQVQREARIAAEDRAVEAEARLRDAEMRIRDLETLVMLYRPDLAPANQPPGQNTDADTHAFGGPGDTRVWGETR